jgi:hypothetical protein
MKLSRRLGLILVAAWLIIQGLVALFGIRFEGLDIIIGILATAAGVVLLIALSRGGFETYIGMFLLGVWLAVEGLLAVFETSISFLGTALALVAVVAGVLIIVGR